MENIVEDFVCRIRGYEPGEDDEAIIKSVTVRMDIALYARVLALSTLSNQSMNTSLVNLIQVGQAAVWNRLDEQEKGKVDEISVKTIKEHLEERKDGAPIKGSAKKKMKTK